MAAQVRLLHKFQQAIFSKRRLAHHTHTLFPGLRQRRLDGRRSGGREGELGPFSDWWCASWCDLPKVACPNLHYRSTLWTLVSCECTGWARTIWMRLSRATKPSCGTTCSERKVRRLIFDLCISIFVRRQERRVAFIVLHKLILVLCSIWNVTSGLEISEMPEWRSSYLIFDQASPWTGSDASCTYWTDKKERFECASWMEDTARRSFETGSRNPRFVEDFWIFEFAPNILHIEHFLLKITIFLHTYNHMIFDLISYWKWLKWYRLP